MSRPVELTTPQRRAVLQARLEETAQRLERDGLVREARNLRRAVASWCRLHGERPPWRAEDGVVD